MKKNIRLKDFKEDEHIITVARKHWFIFFIGVVGLVLLFLIPFFFIPFLLIFISAGAETVTLPPGIGFFFASFWALVLWNMLFARWTNFYYDVWIVTNWRIIDIEQKGFFKRNVASLLNLDGIQDITTEVSGFFGTILDYGVLQIQTAAARTEFVMPDIAHPREVERVIRKAQEVRIGLRSKE